MILKNITFLKKGSSIHIKAENRGKFTEYCNGNVTNECILRGKNSSNPAIRKRATFALNSRKWKHLFGGILKALEGLTLEVLPSLAESEYNRYGSMTPALRRGIMFAKTKNLVRNPTPLNLLNALGNTVQIGMSYIPFIGDNSTMPDNPNVVYDMPPDLLPTPAVTLKRLYPTSTRVLKPNAWRSEDFLNFVERIASKETTPKNISVSRVPSFARKFTTFAELESNAGKGLISGNEVATPTSQIERLSVRTAKPLDWDNYPRTRDELAAYMDWATELGYFAKKRGRPRRSKPKVEVSTQSKVEVSAPQKAEIHRAPIILEEGKTGRDLMKTSKQTKRLVYTKNRNIEAAEDAEMHIGKSKLYKSHLETAWATGDARHVGPGRPKNDSYSMNVIKTLYADSHWGRELNRLQVKLNKATNPADKTRIRKEIQDFLASFRNRGKN